MFEELRKQIQRTAEEGGESPESDLLADIGELVCAYNVKLHNQRHCAEPEDEANGLPEPPRHPCPQATPYRVFLPSYTEPGSDWNDARGLILGYYDTVIAALETQEVSPAPPGRRSLKRLGSKIVEKRDAHSPHWTVDDPPEQKRDRARLLKLRTLHRREEAERWIGRPDYSLDVEQLARSVLEDNLGRAAREPRRNEKWAEEHRLHRVVLAAFVDAHLTLHSIESRLALPLGERMANPDAFSEGVPDSDAALARCVALNTFVFAAARAVPWIFAENAAEARQMVDDYPHCWRYMVPTLCAWVPTQLSLLALHHRGYCHKLRGDSEGAYKDFQKVQRLSRDARRRVRRGAQLAPNARDFLVGLEALADYHTGELYRADHAHTKARDHFERAIERFGRAGPEGAPTQTVLENSRWRVDMLLSRGKADYELGQLKASLTWHLRSWKRFLELAARDRGTDAVTGSIDRALETLERGRLDPELHKPEVIAALKPVVQQVYGASIPPHLTALAADVLLRLGHLLFVIRLGSDAGQRDIEPGSKKPPDDDLGRTDRPPRTDVEDIRDGMAWRCLVKSAECDPASTLVASDVLKIRYRRNQHRPHGGKAKAWEGFDQRVDSLAVPDQLPGGGEDFDRFSRLMEYLLLRELSEAPDKTGGAATSRTIARDLMSSFFVHTDSISVRKSQLHQYLLKLPRPAPLAIDEKRPLLELVCMRRYGSLFPFLPRPSAFRVLGGGYFLRLYPKSGEAFGVAIDPGPSFVETLYRTGYAVSDIDVVFVTHDHPDHIASLDPLLSVLHEQRNLETPRRKGRWPVSVLGNQSVVKRYRSLSNKTWKVVDVADRKSVLPEFVHLTPIDTDHEDLGGHSAWGLHLTLDGNGPSIALTTDVPSPEETGLDAWRSAWSRALDADVLVAHLSSVPLVELRELADLGEPRNDRRHGVANLADDEAAFMHMWKQLERVNPRVYRRLGYASWINQPSIPKEIDPVGPVRSEWMEGKPHLYLGGTLACADEFSRHHTASDRPGVFVVGELSEELGTFRTKVADGLNRFLFKDHKSACRAVSGDIGLTISVRGGDGIHDPRILCSTCDLDNDLVPDERYHEPDRIREVCVKGENEGIFYNCLGHDPSHQEEPTFLERMERYDIFGR